MPIGTVFHRAKVTQASEDESEVEEESSTSKSWELVKEGAKFLAARGGAGGKGKF